MGNKDEGIYDSLNIHSKQIAYGLQENMELISATNDI